MLLALLFINVGMVGVMPLAEELWTLQSIYHFFGSKISTGALQPNEAVASLLLFLSVQ